MPDPDFNYFNNYICVSKCLSKTKMFNKILPFLILYLSSVNANSQSLYDNFEGKGNINSWKGDDCSLKLDLQNPFPINNNLSAKVLEYSDNGGLYANIRFDVIKNFDLTRGSVFSFKIYVPSNGLTGNQNNQVSIKLQNGNLNEPWSTQSEIIKSIVLNEWQIVTFDFENDNYKNLNSGSLPPIDRKDFNRVVIQINGENNRDKVKAYIDDFEYTVTPYTPSAFTKLVWSDEFNDAGPINSNNWFHQTQLPTSGSWYNGEIQHYTNRVSNSIVENGFLKIIAQKESFTDQGYTKSYTSARLNSKFAFKYGRVEFRAKLPTGIGTWPAVWMLGKNIEEKGAYWYNLGYGSTPWPACGEIDILEHWGNNQNFIQSAVHTSSSYGNTVNLGGQMINTASTAFHVYTLEWTPDKLVFSVDSVIHYTYEPALKNNNTWPFDSEQYLLINIAIQPNISQSFTKSSLEMDYIRIYQQENTNVDWVNKSHSSKVYPNPFVNEITINTEHTNLKKTTVQIYNADGKMLLSNFYDINDNKLIINQLDNLSSGIYFLNYTLEGKTVRTKISK